MFNVCVFQTMNILILFQKRTVVVFFQKEVVSLKIGLLKKQNLIKAMSFICLGSNCDMLSIGFAQTFLFSNYEVPSLFFQKWIAPKWICPKLDKSYELKSCLDQTVHSLLWLTAVLCKTDFSFSFVDCPSSYE